MDPGVLANMDRNELAAMISAEEKLARKKLALREKAQNRKKMQKEKKRNAKAAEKAAREALEARMAMDAARGYGGMHGQYMDFAQMYSMYSSGLDPAAMAIM